MVAGALGASEVRDQSQGHQQMGKGETRVHMLESFPVLALALCPVAQLHPPGLSILLSLVPQGKKNRDRPPPPKQGITASLKSKIQGKDFLKGVTLLASSLLLPVITEAHRCFSSLLSSHMSLEW